MLNSYGQLEIRATKADGALPVTGATVRIMGAEEDNRFVVFSLKTDIDGNTMAVTLPAPSAGLSQEPGSRERGYAIYDVEVNADGYYPKLVRSVPIFAGIKSIQPINMIPLSENNPETEYPNGNLSSYVNEGHLG